MPNWLIRLLSLAALVLAAVGAVLGLLPFTGSWGLVLLFVSLAGGLLLLIIGWRKSSPDWPRGTKIFTWWAIGLSLLAIVTVLVITGSFSSCGDEVQRAAETYRADS